MQHLKPRYKVIEAAELLGMKRAKAYVRIKEGALRASKDGDQTFVSAEEIDRYAKEQEQNSGTVPERPAAKAGRERYEAAMRAAAPKSAR